MFNTSGLETPPWSTKLRTTSAMVILNKQKSATPEDKKQTSAGMFASISPPACLEQCDLITIPAQSTLLAIQIAASLAGFFWCGALKMNLCGWLLSLHLPRISLHNNASGEENRDLVSEPRLLARSIAYSFLGVRRCQRDLPQQIRYQSFSGSLTRKVLEAVGQGLLLDDSNTRLIATGDGRSGVHDYFPFVEYIIFTEAVDAVNESRVYVCTILWRCTESPRWQSHLHFQQIDCQSQLRVRTICLSLMTRRPRINNQGIFHHHIELHKISWFRLFLFREAASPGAKVTCLYASLFCIPAMNVTGQFALSLAEGYNRYCCPCRKDCDSERSPSLLQFR
jgi:hypothetical protein